MSKGNRYVNSFLLAAVLAAPLLATGCAERHYYRVYDPCYHDYHHWDDSEIVFYSQWTVETHRDPHREFRKLNSDEQREYWEWRHRHGDHDHDRR
jgi:hypothetical protein